MDKKEKINQITEGVIWKQLLLFFFPIVFGTFFQQIYNTADTIVVGRFVGKQALAAVGGSASQIANLIVGFFVGLSSGAAVVISQFYGAKDKKNLSKALHTAFAFSIAAGIVLTVVGIFLTRPALLLMKTPADVVEDSAVYLHIYFGGMVFNLVYNMGAAILRAVGDSKRPLYVLIITCVLNIILDLLFVVAFGMGVTGVAVATVTSQVISALIVTVMLLKTREIYVLKINQIRFDRRMLFSVLRIGIPAGLESVMYNISNIVIQVFVNNLGTDTVAAWGTLGKDRCYFLDGDQCVCNFHYYLCGTEFRSRQISPYAKECECLHGHEYGQFCGDDHFDVFICSLDLSSVYHRQRSDRPWCSYESFFTAVLFHLCDHRDSVRGTEGYREGSGAYAPYLRRCVFPENPVAFYSRTDVPGN